MENPDRLLMPAADCVVSFTHNAHGKPSYVWPYNDANGELLGFVCRFDTAEGKQILPRTLWSTQRNPDGEWLWRIWPEPRPLYGLDKLDAHNSAIVMVCEGEKATDAAQQLFPAFVCITSSGGSNSAHKTDWQMLVGRTVIIWPDADDAGQKYANAVADIIRPIANVVTILTPPDDVPKCWDTADALAENWNHEQLNNLLATAKAATVATPVVEVGSESSNCSSSSWPEPLPLDGGGNSGNPYPVYALPPLIRNAVVSYQEYGQQPLALVATSALSNVSLACQGLADVARDSKLIGPSSLFFILVAESGERKTASDRIFSGATIEWELNKHKDGLVEAAKRKGKIEAHKAKMAGVQKQISKLSSDYERNRSKIAELERQLEEWEAATPKPIIIPKILYENASQEQLSIQLSETWPSAGLYSDEAAIVVGSHGMKEENALSYFGFLNRLWDGRNYKRDRVSAPSCYGIGRRLSCSLMMQEHVMRALLRISDGQSRNTGFLARILFAYPQSTMGTRKYKEAVEYDEHVRTFHARIVELLNQPLPTEDETMALKPLVLELDKEAHALWVDYYNETETKLGKLGDYETIKDFAAKSAENAARIAANFHIFEHGVVGCINAEMMQRGIAVAAWHLEETKRIFSNLEEAQEITDAKILQEWILKRGHAEFSMRELMQYGPNNLRKQQARRVQAVEVLIAHHIIAARTTNNRTIYQVNPSAF